jgi:hypothetical protein
MCSISVENIKPIIEILSAILSPLIAIFTGIFIFQQKKIQEKQKRIELLKLRLEHIKGIFDTWGLFHQYIVYIKGYKAQIIVPPNNNYEDVIFSMEKIRAELFKYNFSTKYLFSQEIYKLEKNILDSLKNFIPSYGIPWTIYNLPIEEYSKNREMFNNLYKKYEEIMDKEGTM